MKSQEDRNAPKTRACFKSKHRSMQMAQQLEHANGARVPPRPNRSGAKAAADQRPGFTDSTGEYRDTRTGWLRGRDSNRHLSNRTGRPASGRCIRLEMGRGPKAGYRGGALQSCQPAAIDETPGWLINSRAATTQNAQKP